MNRICRLVAFVALFAMPMSCIPYEVDEILYHADHVSLIQKGAIVMGYEENTWQMSYNAQKNEFRVMDDDMADYFIVRFDADPSMEGQELTGDLTYTMPSRLKTLSDLEFKVEGVSSTDGLIRLWCQSEKLGVIVRKF